MFPHIQNICAHRDVDLTLHPLIQSPSLAGEENKAGKVTVAIRGEYAHGAHLAPTDPGMKVHNLFSCFHRLGVQVAVKQ